MTGVAQRALMRAGMIIALAGAPAQVAGQSISGRLLEIGSARPIEGADVAVIGEGDRLIARALTNADGGFTVRMIQPATYRVRVLKLGYLAVTTAPLDLLSHDSLAVEVRMSIDPIPLDPLTVVGRRPRVVATDARLESRGYYERKQRYGRTGLGFAHFLEGAEIRQTAMRISDVIRDVPGVRIGSEGGRRVGVYGRRGFKMEFFVDGVRVRGGVDDGMMLPTSVTAVEVYPTGTVVPAEFTITGGASCGVVAIWTGLAAGR